MDKSTRQEFYEKRYFHELESREKIESRLKTPLTMFAIVFGLLAYLIKEVLLKSHFNLGVSFWFLSGVTVITFIISLVYFFRTLHGYHYLLLPTPVVLEEYYKETMTKYTQIDEEKADIWTSEAFDEYLLNCYIKYTTQNTLNNDAKSLNLNRCISLLMISFVSTCLAYVPFYYHTVFKGLIP